VSPVRAPRWSTSAYLLYAGGLTVLGAALGALAYLSSRYGDAAYAGWAALVLVVLSVIAHTFKRQDRWIAAGIFAFASVIAWAAFVGALWTWFGWLKGNASSNSFAGFSVARLSLELLVLVAALDALRRFRFPFIAAISVFTAWLFVTDLVSGGGSWSATVTLFVGLVYFAAGAASRKPSAFWLQLAAGTLIGGSLLYWWHAGDTSWSLIAVASLVFVLVALPTRRASWAVLGTLGFFAAATHFSAEWGKVTITLSPSTFRGWVPSLVFAFVGFLLVGLGLYARRRQPGGEPLPAE
jgi:hypothetical protein